MQSPPCSASLAWPLSESGPSPKSGDFTDQLLDATDKDGSRPGRPGETGTDCAEAMDEQRLRGRQDHRLWHVLGGPLGLATVLLCALPVFGMGAGGAMTTKPQVVWSKKVRRKGRPILGFISGLLGGLGVVVLLWQYAVWTLQIWNVIGIPVLSPHSSLSWPKPAGRTGSNDGSSFKLARADRSRRPRTGQLGRHRDTTLPGWRAEQAGPPGPPSHSRSKALSSLLRYFFCGVTSR